MLLVRTKLRPSKLHGIGLFADQFIPEGIMTWEYSPEYDTAFTKEQIEKLPELSKDRLFDFLYFDKDMDKYVLCCDDQRFINHSSKNYNVLSAPRRDIALRDIEVGEELICDFNHFEVGYFERRNINEFQWNQHETGSPQVGFHCIQPNLWLVEKRCALNTEFAGVISGAIISASAIPYVVRIYQGKIKPNIVTWSLWTLIGLVLLLTYKSSGARDNIWPVVFMFLNPLLVMLLVVFKQRGEWGRLNTLEKFCLGIGLASLAMWFGVRESKELSQYVLYVALVADACAAIPTIVFVWRSPADDRPFAWVLFAFGFGVAIFAISEHTIANYALPVWMALSAFFIALPLVLYRMKWRVPIKDWV